MSDDLTETWQMPELPLMPQDVGWICEDLLPVLRGRKPLGKGLVAGAKLYSVEQMREFARMYGRDAFNAGMQVTRGDIAQLTAERDNAIEAADSEATAGDEARAAEVYLRTQVGELLQLLSFADIRTPNIEQVVTRMEDLRAYLKKG